MNTTPSHTPTSVPTSIHEQYTREALEQVDLLLDSAHEHKRGTLDENSRLLEAHAVATRAVAEALLLLAERVQESTGYLVEIRDELSNLGSTVEQAADQLADTGPAGEVRP